MLECGEITRDYGVEQKTATIEKNSGKKFKMVFGLVALYQWDYVMTLNGQFWDMCHCLLTYLSGLSCRLVLHVLITLLSY